MLVIGGFELDDGAGALGQPVHAEQVAAEGAQRGLEHGRGDRRGAVGDRPQRGEVALRGPGHGGQHLQDRRHEDGVGHALAFEDLEHRRGVEVADQDGGRAVPEAAVGPADAADVEHRQRGEADRVRVELPAVRRHRRRREVRVRRQHALGHTGGAGRVHLHDHVRGLAAVTRIDRRVCGQPRLVLVSQADQPDRGRPATSSPATSAYAASAISSGASASARIAASSGDESRQLSGTITAPTFAAANSSSSTSGAVRPRYAIRAPRPAPSASSACARRLERSSSSA